MIWFRRGKAEFRMNFQDLHENLRLELLRRIELGGLTGTALARQAGFQQAHISNFLNRRRALSLEGLDRVLAAQGLTVDQLLPLELSAAAAPASTAAPATELESVPVVSAWTAMEEAEVRPGAVIETVEVPAAALRANRWWTQEKYALWRRYVAIRVDAQQAAAMEPLLPPGAIAILDRHYRSLAAYRAQQRTLYAVRSGSGAATGLALRYVEFDGGNLILRPLAVNHPVQVVAVGERETPADYIVGRVCWVAAEM
jgi:transcriptional regulator with XRE-family HTH domain